MSKHNNQIANSLLTTFTCEHLHFDEKLTPEQVFSPFSNTPWAMWLDSCNSEHIDSRYDIIVWAPDVTLSTTNNITTIINNVSGKRIESTEDPLTLVDQNLKLIFNKAKLPKTSIPFNGGAVGYFSYDLGRRFETLPVKCDADINLAEMSIGIYSKAIIFDNIKQEFYLFCEENSRSRIKEEINHKINAQRNKNENNFILQSEWHSNMSESEYKIKFNQVHNYLLSGDCYQINLTQRFTATYQGNEFEAYKTLRRQNNAPFSGFIRLDSSCILSLSPERFLQLENKKVQSKPIKGTKARHLNIEADNQAKKELLNSTKDKAENVMIVDLLRNDISKVCIPGSVKVPKLFDIESFPAVHHLVSTVIGDLAPQFNGTDLIRGAFPGGSITGAPKIRAMEIIEELEPHRRSIYCGSIGYISACGNIDTSITIRTLICENNKIHCWAGGGLVADSNVDNEYQETFDKVNKILPVLKQHFYK